MLFVKTNDTLPMRENIANENLMNKPGKCEPGKVGTLKYNIGQIAIKVVFLLIFIASVVLNVLFAVQAHGVQRAYRNGNTPSGLNRVCLDCQYFEDNSKVHWITNIISREIYRREGNQCCFGNAESLHELSTVVSIFFKIRVRNQNIFF